MVPEFSFHKIRRIYPGWLDKHLFAEVWAELSISIVATSCITIFIFLVRIFPCWVCQLTAWFKSSKKLHWIWFPKTTHTIWLIWYESYDDSPWKSGSPWWLRGLSKLDGTDHIRLKMHFCCTCCIHCTARNIIIRYLRTSLLETYDSDPWLASPESVW